jgi:hypothetical protein
MLAAMGSSGRKGARTVTGASALLVAVTPACASLIGADFDVQPEPASSATTSTTIASGGAGGTASHGGGSSSAGGHGGHASGGAPATDAGPPPDAGACDGGPCGGVETLVAHLARPWSVVVADGYAYYTVSGDPSAQVADGRVERVPTKGGKPAVLAQGVRHPNQVVVSGGYAYFTTNTPLVEDAGLFRVKVDGSATVEPLATGHPYAVGLTVDATGAYFIADAKLWKVDLAAVGAGAVLLADGSGSGLVSQTPTEIVWASYGAGGSVRKVLKAGGTITNLVDPIDNADGVVASAGFVYFTSMTMTGRVGRVDLMAPGQPVWLASGLAQPSALVVDGAYAYWTDFGGGTIERVLTSGAAPPETLVAGEDHPDGVALDGDALYWVDFAPDGALKRLPRAAFPK